MSSELVAKGVLCITAVKKAYDDLEKSSNASDVQAVKLQLVSLQSIGKTLQKEAVKAKDVLVREEKILKQKLDELTMKKSELEDQVTRLNDDKASAEAQYSTLNSQLSDKNNDLEQARRDLSAAEDNLQRVKRDADSKSDMGATIGAIFGGLAGRWAGSEIASLINESESKLESARSRLGDREDGVQRMKKELRDIEISLSKIQHDISNIQSVLSDNVAEISSTHNQIGAMKKSIGVHLNAAYLWELFAMSAESATDITKRLKDIVIKATKPENMQILKSNGVTIKVTSFMEAWKEISMQGQILAI